MIKDYFCQQIIAQFGHIPTPQQAKAIKALSAFITESTTSFAGSSAGSLPCFLLTGYAGTGKTSLVSALVKTFRLTQRKCVLLAPTGRAAKVFSQYASHKAFTIHKHIYLYELSKTADPGAANIDFNRDKGTVFIVDEASMISNDPSSSSSFAPSSSLLADLIKYVYEKPENDNRLIILGDTAQLPPVGEIHSPALNPDMLRRFGLSVVHHNLTQVVRQKDESGILTNATNIRGLIQNAQHTPYSVQFDKDVINIPGNELVDAISDCYNSAGIDETCVVCRSNKRALIYNNGIRNQILGMEAILEPGDIVMIAKNNYFWLQAPDFLANGDIAVVKRISHEREEFGFHFADCDFVLPDYDDREFSARVILDTLQSEAPALSHEQNEMLFQNVMADYMHITNWRKRVQEMRQDPFYNALQIKYAYAVTCHKAQGGQWKNVFVDQGYITDDIVQQTDYLRWLYTAFTRATEKLFLVNWQKIEKN